MYVYCGKCRWSQDDFWDFGFRIVKSKKFGTRIRWNYNPISWFIGFVRTSIKPRRIKMDFMWAKEMGLKRNDPHSWYLIWLELKNMIWIFRHQKWWTYKQWKNDKNKRCPICGHTGFGID